MEALHPLVYLTHRAGALHGLAADATMSLPVGAGRPTTRVHRSPVFGLTGTREPRPEGNNMAINRTQALVLGSFVLAWASVVALFALRPEVYGHAFGLSYAEARLLFLGAITAFLALLSTGVIPRWRWVFWLIFVASFSGRFA